uniref:Bromo domain-containing protein n=1 Tax=Caenorhabditis tropicalis TaxID=1561998 RepID=A0A1I7UV64_9PELO
MQRPTWKRARVGHYCLRVDDHFPSGKGYFQASSYRPSTPTVKIFKDIGIQVDPIETMVDKRNTDEVYVEVGGKRLEEMDLSDDRVKLLNSAFDSVALPFDHSYMNENWTHQQVVEVVAQLLPHAAAHAIESLEEIEGPSLCRFNAETLEGKELFKNLNFHSANISTVDFLKVNEHFKTVFAARAPKAEIPAPRNAPARSPTPPPALEAAPADQASRSPTPEPSTSNSATVKPPTSQDVRQSRRSSPSPSPASDTNLTSEPSTSQVNGVVAESQSPAPSEAATPEELNGQAVNGVVGEIPEEPASPAPIEDRNPQVDEIDMEEEPLAIEVDERQDADGEDRDESRPQSAVVSEGDLLSDISISEFSEDDEDVDFARLSPISLDDGVAEGAEAPEVLEDQEAPAENPEAVEEDPEPLGDRSPEEIKEFQVAFEQQFYDDIPYHGDNLELAPKVREVENRDDVEDDAPRSPDAPSNSGTSNGPTPSPSPSNMDQGDADQNGGNMEEGQEDDREPDVTPEPSRDNEEPSSSQPLSAADSPAPSDDSAHEARKTSLGALEDSMMEPAQPAIHQPTKTETVSIEANNALQSTSKTPSTDQMEQVPSISYKTAQYAPEKSAILEDQAPTPEVFASPEASASPEVHAAAPGPQKRGAPESPVSEPPAKRARVEPEEKGCQTEEEIQKVDDLYKPEEKLDASTKEKTLLGVDLEELVRKRVEMHSENFRHVCLPFNHSLDFKSWTQEEVLEMASQFMGAVEVEGLRLAECDGKIIWDLTKEELFLKLNETRAIISWRALEKFIEMLVQLETGLARNAAGGFFIAGTAFL